MADNKSKNLHWYPGHMKKATIKLEENAKFIDFVVIVLDSRAPFSSFNLPLMRFFENKPKLFILNKIDLSDENETKKWIDYYTNDGNRAITFNSKKNINKILEKELFALTQKKREKSLSRGIKHPIFKGMVIGVPNSGKSTFINCLIGSKRLDAQDRPGVTRNVTWIKVSDEFLIMDTPGILTPKFEEKEIAIKLALVGSIKQDILPLDVISARLFKFLVDFYKEDFKNYLRKEIDENDNLQTVLNHIAKTFIPYKKGGELDLEMANLKLLNDFRDGKIAKITVDRL